MTGKKKNQRLIRKIKTFQSPEGEREGGGNKKWKRREGKRLERRQIITAVTQFGGPAREGFLYVFRSLSLHLLISHSLPLSPSQLLGNFSQQPISHYVAVIWLLMDAPTWEEARSTPLAQMLCKAITRLSKLLRLSMCVCVFACACWFMCETPNLLGVLLMRLLFCWINWHLRWSDRFQIEERQHDDRTLTTKARDSTPCRKS